MLERYLSLWMLTYKWDKYGNGRGNKLQKIANEQKKQNEEENQQINTTPINNENFKVIILEKCTVQLGD